MDARDFAEWLKLYVDSLGRAPNEHEWKNIQDVLASVELPVKPTTFVFSDTSEV